MRVPRLDVAGYPMHLVQRGVNRARVFRDDADREGYLTDLARSAAKHGLRLHGYALMDNHVHLLVSADAKGAAGATMRALGARFGRRYNARHGRTGHLWEARFRSFLVDTDRYLLQCLAYVERNPVRAGMVARAEDFRWSSARHHLGLAHDPHVTSHATFIALGDSVARRSAAWRRALEASLPAPVLAALRRSGRYGHPFGGEAFAAQVALRTGLPTGPVKRGRPPSIR